MPSAIKMGRMIPGGTYPEHKCANCGKSFRLPCTKKAYPFRINHTWFCRWSCMQEYERTHKVKHSIYLDYLL